MAVKAGDILRDKYRIDALIGRGGMGHVFAATILDAPVRTQVAIKVVSRLLVDDILMMRLHREAEAAQRIQSEFVPRVLEVSDTEDGETFLVMERLVGEPLSQRIRDNGALPWTEVARIGEDVLRGLIDAHEAGIIHRDLKPSNVFLALKSGKLRAMVLDFGVCKMAGLDAERLTGTGESIGTVAYMAPEQIRGAARVDERADLYAFGVLVFEMLSGRLPHEGPSQMAILASKLEKEATRLRDCTRVTIPQAVDDLVAAVLERDPEGRPASARELLDAWVTVSGRDPRMVAATSSAPTATSSENDVTVGRGSSPRDAARDAPTQISKPPPALLADMADTDKDLRDEARRSSAGITRRSRPSYASGPTLPPTIPSTPRAFVPSTPPPTPSSPPSAAVASYPPAPQSLPPEPHPTQTSLTTYAGGTSRRAQGRSARVALVFAACGLIAGIAIVGISFTRDEPPASSSTSSINGAATASGVATTAFAAAATGEGASIAPAVSPSVITIGDPPADSDDNASATSIELPPEPPTAGTTKPISKTAGGGGGAHHRAGSPRPPGGGGAAAKSGTPRITSQPRY